MEPEIRLRRMEDSAFEHYTPQHPLPEEIRKMTRDDTVCQYCGVSYLIHTEIKKLEEKLEKVEKELEYYKGKEDREAALKAQNEQQAASISTLHQQLTAKDNVISMLRQELSLSNEKIDSTQSQLTTANVRADKYREQLSTVLQSFSQLSTIVHQQQKTMADMRDTVERSKNSFFQQIATARQKTAEIVACVTTDQKTLESKLQCVEMELTVITHANKTLTEKLRGQEKMAEELDHCEKEMASVQAQNSQLLAKEKELGQKLEKSVSETRNLSMQVDSFKLQLKQKVGEQDQLLKDKQNQMQKNELLLKQFEQQLREKERELALVQKQLKNLESVHRELEQRQANAAEQNVLTANEARDLKGALTRAREEAEALKYEREGMIGAHQSRIEELRESFKRKMVEAEQWPEKLQRAITAEKQRYQEELSSLETKLKETFIMELKIEKERYDELFQKYQTQNSDRNLQKAAVLADMESSHQKSLQALQQQLKDANKLAENRETDLKSEINSLKRIINDLQNKLGKFESQGEEKVQSLTTELIQLRSQMTECEGKNSTLIKDLQQAQAEVQFLQNTVRSECEERFELTEALGEAKRQLLALKMPSGGYTSAGSSRASSHPVSSGFPTMRGSASLNSLQSASSEDVKSLPHIPTHPVSVSYKAESQTPRQRHTDTVADTRRRISALLGRPS